MLVAEETLETFGTLRPLFEYPRTDYRNCLNDAIALLSGEVPEAATYLQRFAVETDNLTPEEGEELYARTFDIQPVCSLEIGWQLFGEEYHRGTLLVRLRQELRRHGLAESSELPDHLTHVLSLLDRMEPEEAQRFARACVIPAVDRMLTGFADKGNPYEHVVHCVAALLRHRFAP